MTILVVQFVAEFFFADLQDFKSLAEMSMHHDILNVTQKVKRIVF